VYFVIVTVFVQKPFQFKPTEAVDRHYHQNSLLRVDNHK